MKKLVKTIKYYSDGTSETIIPHDYRTIAPNIGFPRPTIYCERCNRPKHNPFDYGIHGYWYCYCDSMPKFHYYSVSTK